MRVASLAHVREHSGNSRLAQHPARGRTAVRRGTRPSRVCGAARVPRRANGRRRASRVHGLGGCSNARDAGRAGPAVCHAHCAGRLLGCLGGHARVRHVRQPRLAAACVQALERGRPALSAAHAAANLLRSEGWQECPTWATLLSTLCAAPRAREAGPGDWPRGWQFHASRTRSLYFRDRVLLPSLEPAHQALLLSPSRRVAHGRTHGQVHLAAARSHADRGQHGHGCRRRLDPWGDHALACTRSGLLARRAKLVEQAWLAVCREAVGAEGHVVPQQWLSHTSAPGVPTSDRRRLELVVYGASPLGLALCCDATLVSPITGTSTPHPRAEHTPGIALRTAESRKRATYPELQRDGSHRLFVLAVEVGGRWNADSQALVRQLARVRALRAPPALRAAASTAWTRRWWGMLSTAVQHAVGGTALGAPWLVSKGAAACEPGLDHVLALAEPAGPSRLPLR